MRGGYDATALVFRKSGEEFDFNGPIGSWMILLDPLDHDKDGKKGGSVPAADDGLEPLREEAEMLGINVDKRWGEKRLREEIASAE